MSVVVKLEEWTLVVGLVDHAGLGLVEAGGVNIVEEALV